MSSRYSVVVPAYNAAATVGATVRSILGQTVADLELIVVDDGSTDETADVVASHRDSRIRLVRQSNTGLPGARNRGIDEARGRHVAFLDADDLWLPEYLSTVTACFEASPAAGVVYSDGWVLSHATGRIRRTSALAYQHPPPPTLTDPTALLRRLIEANFVLSAAVVPKAVLDQVGGFRPGLKSVEDFELWLRIAAAGHTLVRAPGRIIVRREIAGSMSTNRVAMLDGAIAVLDLFVEEHAADPEIRALAVAKRERVMRIRAIEADGGARNVSWHAQWLARRIKRRIEGRTLWFREPPADVAALLRAVEDPSLRSVSSRETS